VKNISVAEANGGCTIPDSVQLTVLQMPTPVIDGPEQACLNRDVTYTCISSYPDNGFTWNPDGGTIVSQTDNTVVIRWSSLGTVTIDVNEDNGVCSVGSEPMNITIVPPPATPKITGPATTTVGTIETYKIVAPVGGIGYTWEVSSHGTIITGQGTPVVKIKWSRKATEEVNVEAINTACATPAAPYRVTVT
jgi:hypothetical protein